MKYALLILLLFSFPVFAGPPKIDPSTLAEDVQFESLAASLPESVVGCICSVNQSPTVQAVEVMMPSDTKDKVELCRSYESKFYPVKSSRDRAPAAYAALLKCEPRAVGSAFISVEPTPAVVTATPDPEVARQMGAFQDWSMKVGESVGDLKDSLERLENRLDRVMIKTKQLDAATNYTPDVQVRVLTPPPVYIPPQQKPLDQPGTTFQTRERDGGKGNN